MSSVTRTPAQDRLRHHRVSSPGAAAAGRVVGGHGTPGFGISLCAGPPAPSPSSSFLPTDGSSLLRASLKHLVTVPHAPGWSCVGQGQIWVPWCRWRNPETPLLPLAAGCGPGTPTQRGHWGQNGGPQGHGLSTPRATSVGDAPVALLASHVRADGLIICTQPFNYPVMATGY